MTRRTAKGREITLPAHDRLRDRRIVGDDLARHSHGGLKNGGCGDIRPRQFIAEPIAVQICIRAKALGRLDAMVVVERGVGEVA